MYLLLHLKNLDCKLGQRLMDRYEIIIYWSSEDNAYIAEVPELPGCMAHGANQEDALTNIKSAMELWINTAKEFNDPIPAPKGRPLAFA
jgi:predicted RNase H-like HicB family nuclease